MKCNMCAVFLDNHLVMTLLTNVSKRFTGVKSHCDFKVLQANENLNKKVTPN